MRERTDNKRTLSGSAGKNDRIPRSISTSILVFECQRFRGSRTAPFKDGDKISAKKILEKSILECDLADLSDRLVTQLSGGELARARIARVIAGEPTLLLLDEPIAGLDPLHQLEIMHLLQDKVSEGLTVILVLHDLSLAARFTNRLVLLKEGRMLVAGPTDSVLNSENLAEAFKINSQYCVTDGIPYVLPTYPIKTLSDRHKG